MRSELGLANHYHFMRISDNNELFWAHIAQYHESGDCKMPQELQNYEQIERVRQAVIKLGGTVTVGDIMSVTGLGNYEAKEALDGLIQTHEGTMRVSEKGEIQYAFAAGCVLRDQRSWWQRNKKAILKVIKGLFKVIIMLVLVIYFVIFMLILIALLFSNRNSDRINISGFWFIFWGGSDSGGVANATKAPLYTRVYNFVFGPEEEEVDPLEARQKCGQLIRAKNGVITVEDWMMISGQTREKCESDLARFTAEFDGTAEITDNGTLVYVFENMMKTARQKRAQFVPMPAGAWKSLEHPRPLSGNTVQNGGDGAVIGLNLFNLIMSFVIMRYLGAVIGSWNAEQEVALTLAEQEQLKNYAFWLGIFPFIFSSLIFLVPLLRLPGNIRENRLRRERSVRKAVMGAIFEGRKNDKVDYSELTMADVRSMATNHLMQSHLPAATDEEAKKALNELIYEVSGELDFETQKYKFNQMDSRIADAAQERAKRALDHQDSGRVVFSTDNTEQERIDDDNARADMDDFDKMLHGKGNFTPVRGSGSYNTSYSGGKSQSSRGNYSSGSGYGL